MDDNTSTFSMLKKYEKEIGGAICQRFIRINLPYILSDKWIQKKELNQELTIGISGATAQQRNQIAQRLM